MRLESHLGPLFGCANLLVWLCMCALWICIVCRQVPNVCTMHCSWDR